MRQGQQNRRGRGRNNNNRKNHNPLGRSFESNGPDVKIRGTPAHIAEKYLTLSRDARAVSELPTDIASVKAEPGARRSMLARASGHCWNGFTWNGFT